VWAVGAIGLEYRVDRRYARPMNDAASHRSSADWEPPLPDEAELLAALAESDAEAEAALFVPGDVVRQGLVDSIVRLEARAAGRTAESAAVR